MNCIFCDIISRKSKAEILYEDEDIISFLDIHPVNFGHTLIIPKTHYENFLMVPDEILTKLILTARLISGAVSRCVNSDGFNVIVNSGSAAGQSVFHFHFHIIPRFDEDDFKFKLNLKNYGNNAIYEYGEKIRSEINK